MESASESGTCTPHLCPTKPVVIDFAKQCGFWGVGDGSGPRNTLCTLSSVGFRALVYGTKGQRFDSSRVRHRKQSPRSFGVCCHLVPRVTGQKARDVVGTPPTRATKSWVLASMLPSSSGLGRRPLTSEIAGSNPVGSTMTVSLAVLLKARKQRRSVGSQVESRSQPAQGAVPPP